MISKQSNWLNFLKEQAAEWKGVKIYYRKEWESEYFDLAGKFFALLGENKEKQLVLTFKGTPVDNELLREQYSFILPGYYTNKTHWNSILLQQSTLSPVETLQLLHKSYSLVLAKLPKKTRLELENTL